MLESVIKNLERTESLKRQDSEVTTSTVETFVSERPVFTLNIPESDQGKPEVGDVERNAEELQPTKGWAFHFYHRHTGAIAITGMELSDNNNQLPNNNNFQYLYPSSWWVWPC